MASVLGMVEPGDGLINDSDHGYWAYLSLGKGFNYRGLMEEHVKSRVSKPEFKLALWKWVQGEAARNGDKLDFDVMNGAIVGAKR